MPTQPNLFLAEVLQHRRDAFGRMTSARARGYIDIADSYERIILSWDAMLARHGITPDEA